MSVPISTSFSRAAHALAMDSLKTAFLPGEWHRAQHVYGVTHDLDLHKSTTGAWGIENLRSPASAQAELFVSRLALYAGVPVAPTFVARVPEAGELPHMVSIVPFERIVYSSNLDYADSYAYLRHTSSALPFLLWLGQDTDRDPRNLCLNAAAKTRFCEFDFDSTSLADAFRAASIDPNHPPEGISESMLHMARMRYNAKVADASMTVEIGEGIPVLRSAFEDGLRRLDAMPDDIVDRVLDIVDTACPVSAYQRRSINTYLELRHSFLLRNYTYGAFDSRMKRVKRAQLPGLNAELTQRSTYRFV
ncbi:MAG: hypothetical protein H6865_01065 [Rhodospirillales bacterium]|nr:hypothetical protein [Alphaproteobacteria bacterium]MCB9986216.1 hypothetical protein [Rhodospirillales bacterium]